LLKNGPPVPITRRLFLQSAVAAIAAPPTTPLLDPNTLPKFVDPLPILGVAKKRGYRAAPESPARQIPSYRLEMMQVATKLHRDLPPTRQWGFDGTSPGPILEMRSGGGAWIEWVNGLPLSHFLPIDHSLHGAEEDKPEVRAVVHVHGAKVPPGSDGYPENWYTPGKSATYYYPNDQDAAMLWYHDHAMGINRLNIYAGLFGVYLLRDDVEDALNLPKGQYEISLVIYDRFLRQDGQLDYPVSGKAEAPWVPEIFGNAMLVNGKLWPHLDVEPRRYRLRLLNGANARFYHLALANGQEFHLIGTDQGLLPAPARLKSFVLAPAERVDVVLDFKDHAGEQIVLNSDSFELMQFRVGRTKTADPSFLPAVLRPVPKIAESAAIETRLLTIDEYQNGAEEPTLMLLNRSHWRMPITEKPVLNSVEIWAIANPTDDSHPIHLHLVRFQILDRRRFDSLVYRMSGQLKYTGPAEPPEANEAGWKDTVRAHSSMVTRIIVRFEGFAGRYVWHCHILEHEDNEMMRPYDVLPSAGQFKA
jgi:spore coat protein A, manganese oxidase